MKPTVFRDWAFVVGLGVLNLLATGVNIWAATTGSPANLVLILVNVWIAYYWVIRPAIRLPREHREQQAALEAADRRWAEIQRLHAVKGH